MGWLDDNGTFSNTFLYVHRVAHLFYVIPLASNKTSSEVHVYIMKSSGDKKAVGHT